jgi:flavin reductase (DIM6/NTAB) family NADH-FMN oxidoreductase RutF
MIIDPKETPVPAMHSYLLGAVAPRPIAFASTVRADGQVNLSPFSFFNVFSANPPVVIFSPARRGRDNTVKHTYENVLQVPEVCISIVSYEMVHQTSLASTEYPREVNEFIKAGFIQVPSTRIKPPRVGESKISMECKVNQVVPLGSGGAAGNLVIAEVILMHISDDVLDSNGRIDPHKLDAVARLGGDWYCRASGDALFRLPQPGMKLGVGIDKLPEEIKSNPAFSKADLARLAGVEHVPAGPYNTNPHALEQAVHCLQANQVDQAWAVLAKGI